MSSSSDLNMTNDTSIDLDDQLSKEHKSLTFADKEFSINDVGISSCEAFEAKTPILPQHQKYLTEISEFLEGTKFADVITIENSKHVQVGHVMYTCHTATEEAFTQEKNTLNIRLIQTYHIESKGWADIGYNFCVGSDGNVYEGRGWFAQGAHTLTYNPYSVGIAFLGCFLQHLPPNTALKRCKDLIAQGVKIAAIEPDYELIAHCQCRPFRSPGPRLFEEIKTWKNFNPHITNTMLCPLEVYEDT
ncbi:unnamed protein product [Ceutorhynchus assimilis]|uniref:Uncharacterized protein n=1 Tax=Ceutorhynchus assimilis TaxID=467358 RepID=A0A9N9MAB4_9CUCU|nr:unnamed protein product [Ceutorhynchus assimilis]